jgi:hypothetical protein
MEHGLSRDGARLQRAVRVGRLFKWPLLSGDGP